MQDESSVDILQRILCDALVRESSDVHLLSVNQNLIVRFRIGGQLHPYLQLQGRGQEVIRRIKALANMDVAEARLPQDGAFRFEFEGGPCDVRAACVPTVTGEAAVLRLLSGQHDLVTLQRLGMTRHQADTVERILGNTSGMILVAGPTGSGKTTTLYAMMLQLSKWGRQVVSIEDPVEMPVAHCQQVEVRERIGVTFDVGLKALLRQDPDAIMIGEIRDEATAKVALRASLTGHLVLSTTHARDVIGAAARLVDFGLARSMVGDVLRAVVVQDLQSVPCRACHGRGCAMCRGTGNEVLRKAAFAIHEMNLALSMLFASDLSWPELRREVVQTGVSGAR